MERIARTRSATWAMPPRIVALASDASASAGIERSRRSSRAPSSDSSARSAASRARCLLRSTTSRQHDGEEDQHGGLEDDEQRVQEHDRQAVLPDRQQMREVGVRIERVQREVVDRDHCRRHDRHAPVAVDEQERERGEDVEVQLQHAVALVDQQR